MGELDGRVAIITGAAMGIGREYARRFHREGASVVAADIEGDLASAVAAEIVADGGAAIAVTVDVADEDATQACVARALAYFGRVDVVVNDAAICGSLDSGDRSFTYFKRVMEVNLYGPLLMTRAVLPSMREQGGGAIVNMASIAAYMYNTSAIRATLGIPDSDSLPAPHYPLSKAGIIALTKHLAGSLGRYGIRVNCLAPGGVETEGRAKVVNDAFTQMSIDSSALGTLCQPSDLADAAVFLASDRSSKITGQVLVVDGGRFMPG